MAMRRSNLGPGGLLVAGVVLWAVLGVGTAHAEEGGRRFRDCAECPELVVVPAGTYMMGSPASEAGRERNEGPQHPVTIGAVFAVGVYEVTFAEWDACVADGGCNGYLPSDIHSNSGRGRRPVINVRWSDAQAYVRWLSEETGAEYRLLSEAEWEYVARAGTTTPYHFGQTISTSQANYGSSAGTVEVGTYPANDFGLHDVHGNVNEWTQDCLNLNWTMNRGYTGAPTDGSAWEQDNCDVQVWRGGSWSGDIGLRSADRVLNRQRRDSYRGYSNVGFRVARTLTR